MTGGWLVVDEGVDTVDDGELGTELGADDECDDEEEDEDEDEELEEEDVTGAGVKMR